MKKYKLFLAVLLILCIPAASAAADTTSYEIPELNMKLDIPDNYYTFTRDVNEKTPNIDKLEQDLEAYQKQMKSGNVYLNSFSADKTSELILSMIVNRSSKHYYDFNLYDNKKMEDFARQIMSVEEQNNAEAKKSDSKEDAAAYTYKYTNHSIYQHKQAKFLMFELSITQDKKTIYSKQYSTIINGQIINLTINSTKKELSDEDKTVLDHIVDSIQFTQITKKPKFTLDPILRIILLFVAGILIGTVITKIRRGHKKKNL